MRLCFQNKFLFGYYNHINFIYYKYKNQIRGDHSNVSANAATPVQSQTTSFCNKPINQGQKMARHSKRSECNTLKRAAHGLHVAVFLFYLE